MAVALVVMAVFLQVGVVTIAGQVLGQTLGAGGSARRQPTPN